MAILNGFLLGYRNFYELARKKQDVYQSRFPLTDVSYDYSSNMAIASARGKLIAVIGDEDTCVGFVLGGVGEVDKNRNANFTVIDKNTSIAEIEEAFRSYLRREDVAIILINQNIAEMIRHVIDSHDLPIPAVLEIPSKDCPYDPSKDSILRRAKGMFSAEDFR